MRLPTTIEPTAPQIRLTRTTANRERMLKSKLKKDPGGHWSQKALMASSSQSVGTGNVLTLLTKQLASSAGGNDEASGFVYALSYQGRRQGGAPATLVG